MFRQTYQVFLKSFLYIRMIYIRIVFIITELLLQMHDITLARERLREDNYDSIQYF